MKKLLLVLPFLAALQPRVTSQTPDPAKPQPHELMHVTVQADRILLSNGEFVPRFATYLPKSLTVPPKQTVTLPADSTYDAIEVAGTLRVDPAIDTVLRVTHLIVLPGGQLDWQVPCGRKLEVIFRDVPIDTARDPFQWGNGLINLGKQVRLGCAMPKTWIPAAGDLKKGETKIALKEAPAGWKAGDELIIPDTQSPELIHGQPPKIRREAKVTIAAIEGSVLTLSKPLDFDHPAVRDPQGTIRMTVDVADFSRNLVLRSENPAGVPGHTATVGLQASWEIRFNEFRGLGRTKPEHLQSTPVDRKVIGKNQVGRYQDHYHHTQGLGGVTQGNAYVGHPGTKWALALHRTSDAVAQWNVCVDTPGACFVTEDGDEARTKFLDNFAAYSAGGAVDVRSPFSNITNPAVDCPGCEGSGLWPRGLLQAVIERNHIWNSNFGIMVMPTVSAEARFPSRPGGSLDSPMPHPQIVPASFADNAAVSNLFAGVEYWTAQPFPVVRQISANNAMAQVTAGPTTAGLAWYQPVVVCDRLTKGFDVQKPYVSVLRVEGGIVAGCGYGFDGGGGNVETVLRNVTLQNKVNMAYPVNSITEGNLILDSVKFVPLGDQPLYSLEYAQHAPWKPSSDQSDDISICRQYIKNWQGTGKNYCLSPPRPAPVRDPFNPARSDNGAKATASSRHWDSEHFDAPNAIDGDRVGTDWGVLQPMAWGNTWQDGTTTWPDWLEVDFRATRTIDGVTVYSLQDNHRTPVPLRDDLTFTLYGVIDAEVAAWVGNSWQKVGALSGNNKVVAKIAFPPVTTSKIRLTITKGGTGFGPGRSALAELEAHSTTPIAGPVYDPNIPRLVDARGHVFTLKKGQVFRNDVAITNEGIAKSIGLCEGSVYMTSDGTAWSKYVGPQYPSWGAAPFSCAIPGKNDEVCGNGIDDDGDGHVDENCRQQRR